MNNFLPPGLKDLTDSKERVMERVMKKVELSPRKQKPKWIYAAMTATLLVSSMFFVIQVTMNNEDGKQGSDTDITQIGGDKSPKPPADEEKIEDPKDVGEAAVDLSKPTFTNDEGVFRLNGITVGDTQEDVIRQLGDSYTTVDDLDGSGADLGMNYDNQLIVYFYQDKVKSILLLNMDEEHSRQMYMDVAGIKFMSGTTRFIYSVETAHIIKMEYTPYGELNVWFSQNDDPNLGENPGFILKQTGGNSYLIALNRSQPIVSIAKENLYLHGITLGDTESKIITYFGEDYNWTENENGKTTLSYGDEMEFNFMEGKLETMRYLKVNENYFNEVLTGFEGVDLYSAETSQMISTEHSTAGDFIVTLHYDEK